MKIKFLKLLILCEIQIIFICKVCCFLDQLRPHNLPSASTTKTKDSVVRMIEAAQYPIEVHTVETSDGYLLSMHRIPHGKTNTNMENRPIVFGMHGMLCSSADFVVTGPGQAMSYLFADAGYDVWLGNARGNTFSKNHMYMSTKIPTFWNFTWHEIGEYDVPAMIDYILQRTNQTALHYVGHSQGVTTILVALSLQPQLNKNIITMHGMAPVAFMRNIPNPVLRMLSKFTDQLEQILINNQMYEFLPSSNISRLVGSIMCNDEAITQEVCSNALFLVCGFDSEQLNRSILPTIFENIPAGISWRQFSHYGQLVQSGRFQMFDYRKLTSNYEVYKKPYPPDYKLNHVKVPTYLYYGTEDILLTEKDVKTLEKKLNKYIKASHKIISWNHLDFLYATDNYKIVYNKIISYMRNESLAKDIK